MELAGALLYIAVGCVRDITACYLMVLYVGRSSVEKQIHKRCGKILNNWSSVYESHIETRFSVALTKSKNLQNLKGNKKVSWCPTWQFIFDSKLQDKRENFKIATEKSRYHFVDSLQISDLFKVKGLLNELNQLNHKTDYLNDILLIIAHHMKNESSGTTVAFPLRGQDDLNYRGGMYIWLLFQSLF